MEALYEAYKGNAKVAFFFVYVNEAHPVPNPVRNDRDSTHAGIGQARTVEDRVIAAAKCMVGLKLSLPALVDTMAGAAEKAYQGRPAATAVIDLEGKVRLHTVGPWGTQPGLAGAVLEEILPKPPDPADRKEKDEPGGGKPPAPAGGKAPETPGPQAGGR